MRCYQRPLTRALVFVLVLTSLTPSSVPAGDLLKSLFKGPTTPKSGSVEKLAQEIDWLERHLEQYGSVVCKQPDVWGQARLTKHREEYEEQMLEQLGGFNLLINGTIERSDQAFFSNSFALQAAVDGRRAVVRDPVSRTSSTISQSDANTMAQSVMTILPAPTVTTGTSAQGPTIFATSPNGLTLGNFGGNITSTRIALEPTLALDQRSRYIQHLHELRRINEGDDTADSPGYALNLVRIPVSLLPGRATREGYGAEVTVTMTPYLSDSLLPTTFRSLVLNDLVRQLALPMTRLVELEAWVKTKSPAELDMERTINQLAQDQQRLEAEIVSLTGQLAEIKGAKPILDEARNMQAQAELSIDNPLVPRIGLAPDLAQMQAFQSTIESLPDAPTTKLTLKADLERAINKAKLQAEFKPIPSDIRSKLPQLDALLAPDANFAEVARIERRLDQTRVQLEATQRDVTDRLQRVRKSMEQNKTEYDKAADLKQMAELQRSTTPALPISRTRRSLSPIPASQMLRVYSTEQLESIAQKLDLAYQGRNIRWSDDCPKPVDACPDILRRKQGRVLVTDAELFLQAELEAAYECYTKIDQQRLIELISTCRLAERIRIGDFDNVRRLRDHFETNVLNKLAVQCDAKCPLLPSETLPKRVSHPTEAPPVPTMGSAGAELFSTDVLTSVPVVDRTLTATATGEGDDDPLQRKTLHALVWAIVVEAALLSEHLANDMKSTALAKGCGCNHALTLPKCMRVIDRRTAKARGLHDFIGSFVPDDWNQLNGAGQTSIKDFFATLLIDFYARDTARSQYIHSRN